MKHRILLADDDPGVQFFMAEFLKKEGLAFDIAGDGGEALRLLRENDYSLAILDEKMPGLSGLELLSRLKAEGMDMPVIMITAYGSKELAVRAVEEGAYDFFTKPADIEVVRTVIRRALEKYELKKELSALKADIVEKETLIAESPRMKKALALASKVAETDVTVFLAGESGSGKELIAKTIHRLSRRRNGPFISVNCAAIPEGLLESELFGYEKGAFTGAVRSHTGKFERASGGSIFLDEIGDLSSGLQAKLLRVLQERQVERLGGKNPVSIDLRVISATNKDIEGMLKEGLFREDLLYRLRVFEIEVPPLRERKEDIPLLTAHFLKTYSRQMGKKIESVSAPAMRLLLSYRWPGNVRELENVLQRAMVVEEGNALSEETIQEVGAVAPISQGLVVPISGEAVPPPLKDKLETLRSEEEKRLILSALEKTRWRRQEAAGLLGMSRKSLFLKMKKHGL